MHQPPTDAPLRVSPLTATRRRSAFGAALLAVAATLVVSCGGSDPSKPIQSLQSAAETARLTVRERLEGSISERYAVDVLESLASTLPDVRQEIGTAPLRNDLRLAGLTSAQQLSAIVHDAKKSGSSRVADAAQLDTLAASLDKLARAAGAKED